MAHEAAVNTRRARERHGGGRTLKLPVRDADAIASTSRFQCVDVRSRDEVDVDWNALDVEQFDCEHEEQLDAIGCETMAGMRDGCRLLSSEVVVGRGRIRRTIATGFTRALRSTQWQVGRIRGEQCREWHGCCSADSDLRMLLQ
jgi:hypothetical protein